MHDSEMYPNPLEFDPERFLGAEPQQDTLKWVFGFGRRVSTCQWLSLCALFSDLPFHWVDLSRWVAIQVLAEASSF